MKRFLILFWHKIRQLNGLKLIKSIRLSSQFILAIFLLAIVIFANSAPRQIFLGKLALANTLGFEDEGALIAEMALIESSEEISADQLSENAFSTQIDVVDQVGGGDFLSEELEIDVPSLDDSALVSNDSPNGEFVLSPNGRKEIFTYVVQSGDSVGVIAEKFNISVATVIWANDLKSNGFIKPGQELIILPVTGIRYRISSRDTLSAIAKKYKADIGRIREFNNISEEDKLAIGDYLIIPDGKIQSVSVASSRYAVVPARLRAFVGEVKQLDDYFIFPTTGRITQGLHPTNAVDIANPSRPPIYAAAAGVVTIADVSGWNGGYGKYIRIHHPNGVGTVYAHFSEVYVRTGETVGQGQIIGKMGSTGNSTGAHLHWEVRGATNPLARYR
ncbi:MAG: hypothetical protein COU81_01500 [Candidatus Portnoybacteria bacterium CG10_big_fil_rev_8_21_14_0_10_36_7]|uniref:LysM domain-containing protein n=1 Tax=Candidatus Portnoybacteria bacterium CG10_big_fil_rev_8_21_14_0_10_36_7 TaxID=1974812 RepID=A0A2M8KEH3_9BACT|nr:MAG: hypothetical protein COU81_01500 [Candidatus Portnoybacteria bacterium CG10_big_fil_rev_8_21_14_0_10_36_7]